MVRESAWEAASCTSRSGTPIWAAVMNTRLSLCGPIRLLIPARRATLRTIRSAACRSSRRWSAVTKIGPPSFPGGQVDRPGVTGRERDGDDLAALAGDRQGPVPAFQAQVLDVGADSFGDRSPLSASREISACSSGGPSPAATSSAPSWLRSRAVVWDS